MRGSKKGPHKCFKTLTDRLTPKYVCPSKGKAGVTALSTMGTRPERAEELEAMGEVRKPPKQQREMESDPIALLDEKEKAREQRHLLRLKQHPQTLHAEESEEATHQKPDTIHYETDEEAAAVKKALDSVLDLLEEEIRVHAATPRFSSLGKSLIIITDLNKAEAPPPTESSQNLRSFLKDNDIKPGETFKRYFKRKKIDIDKFDKHTKEHDPTHSISPGAFTLDNSRDAFLHTPIDSLYRTYKGELGRRKLNSKLNLIKVTVDHYNSLSGNSAYKGSDIEKYKKEQGAQVSRLESDLKSLYGGKKGPAFTKPTISTPKDVKRGIQREKREKIRGAWEKQFPKRLSMLTKEGQEKKLKGAALAGEALLWLMPTTVGAKILSGGAKILAPKTMQALSSIATRLIGGGKAAEGSRKAFVTALEPLVTGASTPQGRAVLNTTLQTAARGKNTGQVISITQGASKVGSPVASTVVGGGGGAATAAKLVPEAASKTAPLLSVVPEVAPAIGSAKEGVAAGAGFSSWLLSQYLRGKKKSKTEGVKAPKHKPQVEPEFTPHRPPKVEPKPTPEVGAPPLKKEKEVSELKQEPTSKTEIKTEPLPETDPGGKRKGRRRTRRRKRRRGRGTRQTFRPRPDDDEVKKLPKREKTPSPVASPEERAEEATRKREKRRGKMERATEEASKKAAARRTQERYQTIGAAPQKFAQLVRKSISTMEGYSDIYKSKSYLAPVVRQILNKRISLKEALDKVPWHMQAELLEQLHKRA